MTFHTIVKLNRIVFTKVIDITVIRDIFPDWDQNYDVYINKLCKCQIIHLMVRKTLPYLLSTILVARIASTLCAHKNIAPNHRLRTRQSPLPYCKVQTYMQKREREEFGGGRSNVLTPAES
jgi:hypothetical protein